jgi:hypothetical protein
MAQITPQAPQKPIPTFSRVNYLRQRRPENLEEIVQNNLFNSNVEVINYGPMNTIPVTNVEHSRNNYRKGMVTPKKGKQSMNVFGMYGQLPSEYGRELKAPGAPVKKLPAERRQRTRRNRKTRRRASRKN